MLELLFGALTCVMEYSIHFMFLHRYLKDRWEKSAAVLASKAIAVFTCAVILAFVNTFQVSLWNVLTVFTFTFLLASLFFQGKCLLKAFLAAVACTLSNVSELIAMILFSAIFGENLTIIVTLPSAHIPMTIISKILLFTLVRVIFLLKKGEKYTKIEKESLLLYVLPVVTVADIILLVRLEYYVPAQESHKILMAFVCMGLIFCNIAVFFIYDKNLKKHELESQLRQAREMQKLQANHYMQLERSLQESRRQMHDFQNHITTLEHLHNEKDNEKAVAYMRELQQQMKEQMQQASFKVKNAAFDVILYEQNKRCKELGIAFDKQILYDDLSFLSYMDTCTIFANALDNAVKACSEMQNGPKKIDFTIKRKKDMLTIVIENTKENEIVDKGRRLLSTKHDRERHGFGLENIKTAAAKYDGLVYIEYTPHKFVLTMVLPIPGKEDI